MKPNQMHILLTGASGGIGQATARRLADAGARIIAVGRAPTPLEDLVDRLPPVAGGPHLAIAADLTETAARARLLEQLIALEQPPNVLINMAGTNQLCLFEQQGETTIEQIIDLNLTSTVLLTHALLPLLRSRPEARIINVGSTFGSIGYPGYVSYCTTKFALRGFSEALGRELADSPVKVQYFAPRATRTSLNAGAADALNEELRTAVDSPEAVADALLSFITDSASHRYLGWPEKLFVRLNGLFPNLVSGSIGKQLATIKNHATKQPENLS